jgi:hypothetical protein
MATRYLIGKGELLASPIDPPPIRPNKAHPYTLQDAKRDVVPQILNAARDLMTLPAEACPNDIAVAKLDLHPAYIAKSFFPKALLRSVGLTSVGSLTIKLKPRRDVRKNPPPISETTRLLVAGPRRAFEAFPAIAMSLLAETTEAIQFAEIENFSSMTASDRLKISSTNAGNVFEIGLHRAPGLSPAQQRKLFAAYAKRYGFTVNDEFEFLIGGMLFLAAEGDVGGLEALAQFSLIRVVRPMPALRAFRPFTRGKALSVGFDLPRGQPLSSEPSVAILDGGLPSQHVLKPFVGRYSVSDADADDVPEYLDHGLGVTSAFLFGPLEASVEAPRPYSFVDHHRVLDRKSDAEDPYELYRTLAHVEEVLLSGRYQFINLSLGPDLPADDDDVHAWTAVLDTHLSDGETLMTVAAGNNGERDVLTRLDRIQVPGDSVNALAIGAANSAGATWDRAPYSARGPGRRPGLRKPDALMFGGSPKEYFHVAATGARPALSATMGTSFAAPFALRTAVGVRAVLGDAVHPLTIKALMIHAAETAKTRDVLDVGWGRIPPDLDTLITCKDGVARILYQGNLVPGKFIRAPIPLPTMQLEGKVKLSATFCYASPVDVEDVAAYTKAGLVIRFRPHSGRTAGESDRVKTRSMFSSKAFRTEQEQRADLGKWENVLHASEGMLGSSLHGACFDIHYNARDGGGMAGSSAEKIRYALVVTVEARRHADLYDQILAAHAKLEALQPKVSVPVRTRG